MTIGGGKNTQGSMMMMMPGSDGMNCGDAGPLLPGQYNNKPESGEPEKRWSPATLQPVPQNPALAGLALVLSAG